MKTHCAIDDDWSVLVTFLPEKWREKAMELNAISRFRAFPDVDALLRTLLALVAEGLSFRDTAVRATWWGCASVSDVAIFKRLKASGEWLRWLAESIMQQWITTTPWESLGSNYRTRVIDGTTVQECGSKGTSWRLHYSIELPSLSCTEVHLTSPKVGESFTIFSVSPNDVFMGDRGFSNARGIAHVVTRGGHVLVRANLTSVRFVDVEGQRFSLLERLQSLADGEIGEWDVWVPYEKVLIPGRICAVRLSKSAQDKAICKALRQSVKKGRKTKPETLEGAKYAIVFTTLDRSVSAKTVLECYRVPLASGTRI